MRPQRPFTIKWEGANAGSRQSFGFINNVVCVLPEGRSLALAAMAGEYVSPTAGVKANRFEVQKLFLESICYQQLILHRFRWCGIVCAANSMRLVWINHTLCFSRM
ncbi:hypothetical protein C2E31_16890 [Rhodopirellula baltica]|nr:hypothetical protein C2E31_16890 [Rhodopirellula baltica]